MSELAEVIARARIELKFCTDQSWSTSLRIDDLEILCDAAERTAQLGAELAASRADAERFRWIEENGVGIEHGCAVSLVVPLGRTSGGEMLTTSVHEENLRDAVDAARKPQP